MKKWLLIGLFILAGCSSSTVPVISQMNLDIVTDATTNPTSNSEANPVVVRVYQLTDKQLFNQTPFIDLYNNDTTSLASNVISKQVLPIVLPNTSQTIVLDVNKNTLYLAVLVEFVDYQEATTKAVVQLPQDGSQYPKLSLSGTQATLELIAAPSSWWQIF
ncbi:type VI secretion system lipoprotein TssJ [Vibrio tapetis]|uniref:Type VI secretion system lipoprotein TssJ n=1 Tax=Vibrio tapetis subsp. tapetis TaxID=1671868 RepID=A0A2N8ZJQ3_9VIBR|nr:type VI secretion system lipoprotein TssJ [Vibrio tapetis]SON52143.1 conserved exported protein of unknown function [Vibrio tapetis subsp. tapetis]